MLNNCLYLSLLALLMSSRQCDEGTNIVTDTASKDTLVQSFTETPICDEDAENVIEHLKASRSCLDLFLLDEPCLEYDSIRLNTQRLIISSREGWLRIYRLDNFKDCIVHTRKSLPWYSYFPLPPFEVEKRLIHDISGRADIYTILESMSDTFETITHDNGVSVLSDPIYTIEIRDEGKFIRKYSSLMDKNVGLIKNIEGFFFCEVETQ